MEIIQIINHYITLSNATDDPDRKESYKFIIDYLTQNYLIGDLT